MTEEKKPKKLASLRILQILHKYSDENHPLKQEDIIAHLDDEYGMEMERKAIGKNIADLREAGVEIEQTRAGSYLVAREFEDSELRLLIDSVLQSKHISTRHSTDLINKLCGLSNKYFRSHVKHIHTVDDWGKTDNKALFYNMEIVDDAITRRKQIIFDYNKYGTDGKLHRSRTWYVSPYQLILHNQRYYLMCYERHMKQVLFLRLDHISNMKVREDNPLVPLTDVPGYKDGIDYKKITTTMPYMYSDTPIPVEVVVDEKIIDQVVDWFGKDIRMLPVNGEKGKIKVSLTVSPQAMEYWALQYVNYAEVKWPESLRSKIKESLEKGVNKYT